MDDQPLKKLHERESGQGKVFDMYRFISRWDVLLAIAVVLLLVGYMALHGFGRHGAV